MKTVTSKNEPSLTRCRELEVACSLWIAANDAKDSRIRELETECNSLRQRVARLSRLMGRRKKLTTHDRVQLARR
jgi:hypothetical protein